MVSIQFSRDSPFKFIPGNVFTSLKDKAIFDFNFWFVIIESIKLLFNCTIISAINKGTVLHKHDSIFVMDRDFFLHQKIQTTEICLFHSSTGLVS